MGCLKSCPYLDTTSECGERSSMKIRHKSVPNASGIRRHIRKSGKIRSNPIIEKDTMLAVPKCETIPCEPSMRRGARISKKVGSRKPHDRIHWDMIKRFGGKIWKRARRRDWSRIRTCKKINAARRQARSSNSGLRVRGRKNLFLQV